MPKRRVKKHAIEGVQAYLAISQMERTTGERKISKNSLRRAARSLPLFLSKKQCYCEYLFISCIFRSGFGPKVGGCGSSARLSLLRVNECIYLDQCVSMDSASKEQEAKRRITFGLQAVGKASVVLRNKDIPIILKRQVYGQCLLPTVSYGSETWNITKQQTLKLRTVQRTRERIIIKIVT